MPPCGYRPTAVEGIQTFLDDNLRYFIELYSRRGVSVAEALASEANEISRIRAGVRGGEWSERVVEINQLFYEKLAARAPESWEDVDREGKEIIICASTELDSLLLERV